MTTWLDAHEANRKKIIEHPMFIRLIREVAVAEQPSGAPRRLRLNSYTYGSWMTRGVSIPLRGRRDRRARLLAEIIAKDTGVMPDSPKGDQVASVYVCAREFVRIRRLST